MNLQGNDAQVCIGQMVALDSLHHQILLANRVHKCSIKLDASRLAVSATYPSPFTHDA